MFLRYNRRFKDGKEHRYWNVVENKRCAGGKVVQRQVLYLGEINDGQREAWCQQIEAFDEGSGRHRQLALFPADCAVPARCKSIPPAIFAATLGAAGAHRLQTTAPTTSCGVCAPVCPCETNTAATRTFLFRLGCPPSTLAGPAALRASFALLRPACGGGLPWHFAREGMHRRRRV